MFRLHIWLFSVSCSTFNGFSWFLMLHGVDFLWESRSNCWERTSRWGSPEVDVTAIAIFLLKQHLLLFFLPSQWVWIRWQERNDVYAFNSVAVLYWDIWFETLFSWYTTGLDFLKRESVNNDYVLLWGHSKPKIRFEVTTTWTCISRAGYWAAILGTKQL